MNIGDVRTQETKIKLSNGSEMSVKFDLNSFAVLEEKYGSIDEMFAQLEVKKFATLRAFLWAGLLNSNPLLTEFEVGAMFDPADMQNVADVLTKAMSATLPPSEDSGNSPQPVLQVVKAPGIGAGSSTLEPSSLENPSTTSGEAPSES